MTDIRYSQHMLFEKTAAQSATVEELELRLAAEGQDLTATTQLVQDLMLLAMGYADIKHSNDLPKQLSKIDEYDLKTWLPYAKRISGMFDVLCSEVQKFSDFKDFCILSAKQLIRYSCGRLQYACGDPQYQHDDMFKHAFYGGKAYADNIAAMLFEALLNHCSSDEISKDEPILVKLLMLMNIDNDYIQFAEGFRSTFTNDRLLVTELYDANILKVRRVKNTIQALINHGADPNQKNNAGISFNDIVSIYDVYKKVFSSDYEQELRTIDANNII